MPDDLPDARPIDFPGDAVDDVLSIVEPSTTTLLHTIEGLTDDDVRAPSDLDGWTRGHVLTHIARNADALGNLLTWARTGIETPMYVSREERGRVIEEQSGRSAAVLIDDVAESAARFAELLTNMTPEQFDHIVSWGTKGREAPARLVPLLRRTEVEVHHVDLGLDYTIAHWPEDFVESLLGDIAAESLSRGDLPNCVLVGNDDEGQWVIGAGGQHILGPPPALLGWITGRGSGEGLHAEGGLPAVGEWR